MMEKEYIILKDNRRVRIEWNANALKMFINLTGIDLPDLVNMKPGVQMLITIAWCSAIEGEAAEGKILELSEMEFGRLMSVNNIGEISLIMNRQTGGEQKKSPPQKPMRVFFRMFS